MAVYQGFTYGSLFEEAKRRGHIDSSVQLVFDSFKTEDFELVLRRLWYAVVVNQALNVTPGKVETAYEQVRNALIKTIRDVHVPYTLMTGHLEPIASFMRNFRTVISLNYDLIVYWAFMLSNDKEPAHQFKDAFLVGGIFTEDWESLRQPYKEIEDATLVFYPHGNISIVRDEVYGEKKMKAGGDKLLDQIINAWESGKSVPVFVCEGTSGHKIKSINGSVYLQRVYREVIPSINESLVIYGWGIGEQESHLLDKLRRNTPLRVAVSVFNKDQSYIRHATTRLEGVGIKEIHFFDSASSGCWNNT